MILNKKNNIKYLFDLAINKGIKNDPRGEKQVKNYLKEIKENLKNNKENKKYFDKDFLKNPYHDSKIYHGKKNNKIKKIIVGIDVGGQEILLVNEYNKKNIKKPIDLIIGHHPQGKALLDLHKLQKSITCFIGENTGIPINQAEKIEEPRIGEVHRRFSPLNHNRATSFSKILNISYFGIHTPADNCCHNFLEKLINNNKKKITKLGDIIDLLLEEIPEMKIAKKDGGGPQIWNGDRNSKCGKIAITGITGGTEGSKDIYKEYAKAGVGTILEMHLSEEHLKQAKKYNINVIMTDHMASDSLGVNLILDEYEKLGIEILDFSGFTRVSRTK